MLAAVVVADGKMTILSFVILALCNGAITLTLTKGSVFSKARLWIGDKSSFLGELIQCPYCTAHWVSFVSMLVFQARMINSGVVVVDYLATTFALVAMTAITAGLIFRLFASGHSE